MRSFTAAAVAAALALVAPSAAAGNEIGTWYAEPDGWDVPWTRPPGLAVYRQRDGWIVRRATRAGRDYIDDAGADPYWCEVRPAGGACKVWGESGALSAPGSGDGAMPLQVVVVVWRCRGGVRAWAIGLRPPPGCRARLSRPLR